MQPWLREGLPLRRTTRPADLDALPVDRKASMLLRMLVTTLVQSGRLRTERSLTHRELCARAAFDDAQQRESFQRVAALAERTVYGVGEVSAAEVEPIVAAARDPRRAAARSADVKDRLLTLALAVGALAAFYVVFVPKPAAPQERVTRPLSTEAGPNGYLGLQRWLAHEGIAVVSLRERFGELVDRRARRADRQSADHDSAPGLPAARFRSRAAAELDQAGNTLLVRRGSCPIRRNGRWARA